MLPQCKLDCPKNATCHGLLDWYFKLCVNKTKWYDNKYKVKIVIGNYDSTSTSFYWYILLAVCFSKAIYPMNNKLFNSKTHLKVKLESWGVALCIFNTTPMEQIVLNWLINTYSY